jgi:hypothetical protein
MPKLQIKPRQKPRMVFLDFGGIELGSMELTHEIVGHLIQISRIEQMAFEVGDRCFLLETDHLALCVRKGQLVAREFNRHESDITITPLQEALK